MKKSFSYIFFSLLVMGMAGCSKEIVSDNTQGGQSAIQTLNVTGSIVETPETRVAFADDETSITPSWEVGDRVFGFYGENKLTYQVESVNAEGAAAFSLISGTEPADGTTVYMIYAPAKSAEDLSSSQLAIDLSAQDGTLAGMKDNAVMCATATVTSGSLSLSFVNQMAIVGVRQFTGLKANTTYTSATFSSAGITGKLKVDGGVLKYVADNTEMGNITATGPFASDASGNTTGTIYFVAPPTTAVAHTFTLNAADDYRAGTLSAKALSAGKFYFMNGKAMKAGIPSGALVQHWAFDGNMNNSVIGGINATSNNAPTLTTDRHGNADSAYEFNGTSNCMQAAGSFTFGTGSFTANVWVCTTGNGTGYHDILRTDTGYGGSNGCMIRYNAGKIEIWEGRSENKAFVTSGTYNDGKWHMLSYVRDVDAKKGSLYIDGTYIGCYEIGTVNSVTGTLSFGYVPFSSGVEYYTGKMDDVRLYNIALTPGQIEGLFDLQLSPSL